MKDILSAKEMFESVVEDSEIIVIKSDYEDVLEAINKQIPMQVSDKERCPSCGFGLCLRRYEQMHCDNCGQKLKYD